MSGINGQTITVCGNVFRCGDQKGEEGSSCRKTEEFNALVHVFCAVLRVYRLVETIGRGSYGTVRTAVRI